MTDTAHKRCRSCGEEIVTAAARQDSVCPRCLMLGGAEAVREATPPRAGRALELAAGTVIDRFTLREKIGEGGFGIVYRAGQSAPVQREVALKVVKAGMDTAEVVKRFEAERQALALMDHPNVATVFDAGTTPEGRPYFVMELVEGKPITAYCDRRRLGIRDRLELFIKVCQAVQHAHQKGILHRDLKPSNVLVTEHDANPVPKVIDFGVAKALDTENDGRTMVTIEGQLLGTFEYMSPEQVRGLSAEIDTRSDVYALGVLLYELLTGTPPADGAAIRKASTAERERLVCEVEPPKPSLRASDSTIARRLRGDLDWIVLKALEKNPNRRYDSVDAFANDISRHLSNDPVSARPPTTLYQLQKFARRNRGFIAAAVTVLAVLLAGIGGTTWYAVRAALAHKESERQRYSVEVNLAGRAAVNAEGNRRVRDLVQPWRQSPFRGWEWHFLDALSNQSEAVLPGHDGSVTSIDWHPDGMRIASSGSDELIRVWQMQDGREVASLRGHSGSVDAVAWCPEGQLLASSGEDGAVQVWRSEGEDFVSSIVAENLPPIKALSWSPNGGRLAAGGTGAFAIVDTLSGNADKVIQLPGNPKVDHITWSGDGRTVTIAWTVDRGSEDGLPVKRLQTWEAETGKELDLQDYPLGQTFFRERVDRGRADGMAWSPDGEAFVLGHAAAPGAMRAGWMASGGQRRSRPAGRGRGGSGAIFSLRLWDVENGSIATPFEHTDTVAGIHCLAWRADGRRIASGGSDHQISIWNMDTETMGSFRGHEDTVNCIEWSPDGKLVASGADDGTIRLWNSDRPSARRVLWKPEEGALIENYMGWAKIAWSPDGKQVASVGESVSNDLWIWDSCTGMPLASFKDRSHSPEEVAWHPNGTQLVTAGADNQLKIWDRETKAALASLSLPIRPTSLAYSPTGSHIACGGQNGQIAVWESASGRELFVLDAHEEPVTHVAFSPDGDRLASAGRDKVIRIWNVSSGKEDQAFEEHIDSIFEFAWSPDGAEIASLGLNPVMRIWDTRTGAQRLAIAAHVGPPKSLAWSRDGKRIVTSGSGPGWGVKLWDPEDGRELLDLQFQDAGRTITQIVWSPDSRALALTNGTGEIMVWDASLSYEREDG